MDIPDRRHNQQQVHQRTLPISGFDGSEDFLGNRYSGIGHDIENSELVAYLSQRDKPLQSGWGLPINLIGWYVASINTMQIYQRSICDWYICWTEGGTAFPLKRTLLDH